MTVESKHTPGQITPDPIGHWKVRIFPQGRWWRYDIQRPSGGGTVSRGYHTAEGARRAANASLERTRAGIEAALSSPSSGEGS